ncbi:MAG: hypothetical protein KGM15_15530 [Pseudomonadota bacterium]|nr:hypothetical protein [Pseudomonadota bacterium]
MTSKFFAASACLALVCAGAGARAADDAPASASRVRVFQIAPEDSERNFMCESGHVESVLANALAEHRIVSIRYLDQAGNPIPPGAWTSAFGFRLAHRQIIKVEAAMICGN